MTCSKFYHCFDMIDLFTIINCHDTIGKCSFEIAYEWLKSPAWMLACIHFSATIWSYKPFIPPGQTDFFWVFQTKGRGFFDPSKNQLDGKFWEGKKPIGGLKSQKKTTSNRFQEKNIRNLQFRWPHRAVWMVRIPRAQGDNWVIRRWHSVPQLVVFHSQQHRCNHPPSHQWSSHHHESKPSLVVDALIWNGVDRDPEKNNLQTSSLPVVICMHPSLSDQRLGCKESLWVALTKTCEENHQKIILFKELFLSSLLNAGTLDDGVMMASVGCILVLNHQKGSDSKIEDKIDNLIHKFPDQDSNIWGLALWHQWFHFPNFPVQQLRIAWHVHSEGRGRHRQHRPVVPAKCRHPCGSREQPMHCKCQEVATSRKNALQHLRLLWAKEHSISTRFVHLATHQCWKDCFCADFPSVLKTVRPTQPVWMFEIWFLLVFWLLP